MLGVLLIIIKKQGLYPQRVRKATNKSKTSIAESTPAVSMEVSKTTLWLRINVRARVKGCREVGRAMA